MNTIEGVGRWKEWDGNLPIPSPPCPLAKQFPSQTTRVGDTRGMEGVVEDLEKKAFCLAGKALHPCHPL